MPIIKLLAERILRKIVSRCK